MNLKSILIEIKDHLKPLLMDTEEVSANSNAGENLEADSNLSSSKKFTTKDVLAAVFNGLGVGLLLGILLGLAVSPVVSAFIGTLSSILVLLIGLNEKYFSVVKSVRIGSFGLFGVVGILLGFYIRSHSPLAPSLADLKEEYISLGYTDSVAKEILLFQEFNVIPKDWMGRIVVKKKAADSSGSAGAENDASQLMMAQNVNTAKRNNVLFSSSVDVGECDMLEYSNAEMGFERLKKNFQTAGGTWKELAENIDATLPEQVKVNTLILIRDVFCDSENTGTVKIECIKFDKPLTEISLNDIASDLKKADPLWKKIITGINESVEPKYQKTLYISLINIFCHD